MTSDLEKKFDSAMQHIYVEAKSKLNYNATRFLQLVSELGGVEAAHRLLSGPAPQYGLQVLWEKGRLDLSVEAHVLKPEFAILFSDAERHEAESRLKAYGWNV
ncbi:MAG TPA: hypothetical protein VMR52_04900 [Dehalococcoidia bacterium]|nr:hypothetical protein [Dehalococcoidia bacterium]